MKVAISALITGLSFVFAPVPAAAQDGVVVFHEAENWLVLEDHTVDKSCFALTRNYTGDTMRFVLSENAFSIWFTNRNWTGTIKAYGKYDYRLSFDQSSHAYEGAGDEGAAGIEIGSGRLPGVVLNIVDNDVMSEFFGAVMDSKEIYLTLQGRKAAQFSLLGAEDAIKKTIQCYEKQGS